MKKRFLSLLCVLALCLGLLPVTAEAAEGAPSSLYVGNQQVISSSDITYWTTDESTGGLTKYEGNNDNWNVKYDQSTATLTLKNANISGSFHQYDNPYTAGIYAQGKSNQPVALTIELIGTNTITGTFGIFLNAEIDASSYGTNATLTITSENNGSLEVSGSNHGIFVNSGTGNASLNIEKATVTSSTNGNYAAGVCVQSGASATEPPNISLAVDGGSLTASASEGSDGILFYVGSSQATGATTSLTVSENAIVDARNGGISASRISVTLPTPTPTGNNSSGIVFDGSAGTVYGSVTLQDDLKIKSGETLTVPNGSSLNCNEKLTNNGTILASGGTVTGSLSGGTPLTTPSISQQPQSTTVTEGNAAEFSITASAAETYQWQRKATYTESEWENISDATTTSYTTAATTTNMNGYQYRCVVTGSGGVSVISQTATLTVQAKPASVPVTGVKLNTETLELFTGNTATLTATVEPDNATNKNVTWQSDNANVATVQNGTVNAVGAGEATITVTTEDGGKTATCAVTVTAATVPVTGVTLNKTSTSLYVGDTETLTATVQPGNASNQTVTWSTSDASVATVENGVVRATGRGTATITVTTVDGGFTADCTVTVSRYSTGGGPTTYAVTAPDAENGTVRVSPSRASRGTTVTITVTPDEGYELESLTVLDSRDNEITLTDKGDGKYTFTMPSGRVTVEASFAEIAPEPLPFGDVDDGDWFADAVRFVYENGMMNGVSETDFAPHATTSRSMIVTILYRLEGEPVVDYAMDFTDVAGDAYYAEAVRWAASEGIVGGYGGGLFGADDAVTREQLAVILYRYAVYKGYDVSIGEDTNILSYADFADLSEYAIPAMQWACGAGVVNGTSESTLTPQGEATRAQVAAMLMRFCEAIG